MGIILTVLVSLYVVVSVIGIVGKFENSMSGICESGKVFKSIIIEENKKEIEENKKEKENVQVSVREISKSKISSDVKIL